MHTECVSHYCLPNLDPSPEAGDSLELWTQVSHCVLEESTAVCIFPLYSFLNLEDTRLYDQKPSKTAECMGWVNSFSLFEMFMASEVNVPGYIAHFHTFVYK